jgi:arsenite/tail-anchored protein-transporting ATPase
MWFLCRLIPIAIAAVLPLQVAAEKNNDDGTIDSLLTFPDLKFVFVGGKGGVGKTTTSSAIATLLASSKNASNISGAASKSRRVLLVSTDPAHSLGDAFRMEFSNTPKTVMPNLDVMELDASETMGKELKDFHKMAKKIGKWAHEDVRF